MDTTRHLDSLRQDLRRVADIGDATARETAERLILALEPSVRMALLDALHEAAGEITAQLDGPIVTVGLANREPVFTVVGARAAAPAAETPDNFEDGDAVARITFRLPESLKVRAEALATQRGQSLNTWLVNAARLAAGGSEGPSGDGPGAPGRNRSSRHRIQGWVR